MIKKLILLFRGIPTLANFIRNDRRFRLAQRPTAPAPTNNSGGNRLIFTCFSYTKDKEILSLSLESLRNVCEGLDFEYTLISDKKSPYSKNDVSLFEEKLGRKITHLTTPYSHGHSGLFVFLNELIIFYEICKTTFQNSFIVKVDSDVLFLESSLFQFLIQDQTHDYFFQDVRTTFNNPKVPLYSQGGCYGFRPSLFLKTASKSAFSSVLKAWREITRSGLYWLCFSLGEDYLMFFRLYPAAQAPLNTTFFVRCPYRTEIPSYEQPQFKSLMHFERCSEFMSEYVLKKTS